MTKINLKTELPEMISELSPSEAVLVYKILKNKMTLGLLEKEAEWISTHHLDSCGKDDCQSQYSGDTNSDHHCTLKDLVLKLFQLNKHPMDY